MRLNKSHLIAMTGRLITCVLLILSGNSALQGQTIAFWPFDEQEGLYPSCVLNDLSDNDYPLVLGPGGMIVQGKFGNGLSTQERPEIKIVQDEEKDNFGLAKLAIPQGRTQRPMSWFNANFAALMTNGEKHLRNQVGFPKVTQTRLNLGEFSWTVEFWLCPHYSGQSNEAAKGVVFEIGTGPRGENDVVTRLMYMDDDQAFLLENQSSGTRLSIPTNLKADFWQHLAFVYDYKMKQLSNYVDGKIQHIARGVAIKSLPVGEEDYMSIGRDGLWNNPLPGILDELRFSRGALYTADFKTPGSLTGWAPRKSRSRLKTGLPLLFAEQTQNGLPLNLGNRKHLFIDDALLDPNDQIRFTVNAPREEEIVLTNIKGSFRKHLGIVEDDDGKIRLYTTVDNDYLAVWISDDGVHFNAPRLPNGKYKDHHNIVLHGRVGMGIVFIDPNAPKEERWKYISDYHRRAVSIFYSEDGLEFKRHRQPILPFRSGSQCNIYYDDQKQVYTAFHRSDFGRTKSGDTQRDFVMTETKNIMKPWPFKPLSQKKAKRLAEKKRTADLIPWYLDNGPLTPGGFSIEYPWIFSPSDSIDPRETDIYVPKVLKYPWAPDTYLAFPVVYFHYEESAPSTRVELMNSTRKRGSGSLETQVAVSRDGVNWKRYPRPVYVGIGKHQGIDFKTSYIAHGMIRRGDEIWQYNFGEPHYHSPWIKYNDKRAVYRLVQRLDGFVSLNTPYEKEVDVQTKPFVFKGSKLRLNIDTDAAGYAQIGFLDEMGEPIKGFSVDDCIFINGDFIAAEVEWMKNRKLMEQDIAIYKEDLDALSEKLKTTCDVSVLQGKTVQLVLRMRGCKLYSMQFVE